MPWFWSLARGRLARTCRARLPNLTVERLEDRLAPTVAAAPTPDRGFFAYDPDFTGGANVAVGDVTADGVSDVVTGAGPGGGPHVQVFDGVSGRVVRSFFAYDASFTGGVNVAVGDGLIVTGAMAGGGPHVKAFDAASGRQVLSFFAYDASFTGGVSVAAGGGVIATGAGPGGGPHVKVFDATNGRETMSYFAYDPAFRGGVNVAVGANRIVTGAGPGGGPHVKVVDATSGRETKSFMAYELAFRGGVNVAVGDVTGDGWADITTGAMAGGGPRVQSFDGVTGEARVDFFAYAHPFAGGVSVATGGGVLATGAGPGGGPHVRLFGLTVPTLTPTVPPALPQVPPPLPRVPPPGNFPADLAGWDPLILGGSAGGMGGVSVEGGVLVMREGDSFRVGLSRPFSVPAAPTAVRVTYERPAFDTTSADRIKDAFEVAVLGADGSPLALPIAADRDSSFNLTEQLDPAVSADTTNDPGPTVGVVTLNLSALPTATAAKLVLRLVNNDTDANTTVRVRRVDFVSAASPAPAGSTPPPDRVKPAVAPDLTTLSDVTPSAQLAYGRTTLTDEQTVLTADVSVRNAGTYPLAGRLVVALGNLSDPSVGVLDPDGYTADGRPVFDFTPELNGTVLQPGRTSAARTLRFTNPNRERFTFDTQVLAGLDHNPVFTTEPVKLVQAGRAYLYPARATDPDGQTLTYSLVGGPAGLTVNPTTGDVTWTTTGSDLGNHTVRLRASDPLGGTVEQAFTVGVRTDIPNRPPIITSTPNTDATIAGAWEVTTQGTGSTPTGILAGNFGAGNSIVTVNAGDHTLTVNGQSTRVGEQAPNGRVFQTGHEVNVGLPTNAVRSSDLQTVPSVVQADVNGDGNLDLITSAGYSINRGTGPGQNFVSVTLNNGDGTFQTPRLLPIEASTDYSLTDTAARNLQVKDFDGDGKADILGLSGKLNIYDDPYGPYQLLFWRGLGDGTFAALQKTALATTLQWIQAADMNGDGNLDLVGVDRRYDSKLGVMLGNGDGSFGAFTPTSTYVGAGYNSIPALVDVDGTNGLDVVLTSFSPARVDVYVNDGTGNLSKFTTFSVTAQLGDGGQSITAGDFNGDGNADVAVTTSNGFGVWMGDGVGFTLNNSNQSSGYLFNTAGTTATDVNGDGKLDLLYGRANSGTSADQRGLFVALGRGDGTFAFDRYAVGNDTTDSAFTNSQRETSVLAGDYNRDGVMDLAVTTTGNQGSRAFVTVIDGVTSGSFSAPKQVVSGQDLRNALIGDVNNDGNPDVVSWVNTTGNLFSQVFRTSLGNGDGTFAASQTSLAVSGSPISAYLTDINKDGKLDLVLSLVGQSGTVYGINQVALGNGDGTFTTSFNTYQGNFFYGNSLFTGDFNNDGYEDLVAFAGAVNAPGTGTFVDGFYDIYLNDGGSKGTFTLASHRVIPVGTGQDDSPKSVAIADFDGDGKLDVVNFIQKTGSTPFKLLLLKGNGDGSLADPVSTDVLTANTDSVTITWSAAGDMNGDGKADLVTFGAYGQLSIFLGKGDGTFATPVQYPGGSFPTAGEQFRLLDFNGDGRLDVVKIDTGPFGNKEGLSVRFGNGDGTLAPPQVFTTFGNFTSFSTGDLDGDGRQDVLATTSGGQATAYLGTKPGLAGVVTGDANGDAKADVLAVNTANDRVKVLLGTGNNTFNRRVDVTVGRGPVALATADFDGDGRLDIATANRTGRSVTVLRGDGLGGFTRADVRVGVQPVSLAVGDLTGDGKPDILVADDGSNAAYLLVNTGTGFATPAAIPLGDKPNNVTLADITGDGKLDAIFTLPDSKRLMILPGQENGTFGRPIYVNLPATPGGLTSGDFNQDGKIDLAVTFPTEGSVGALYGRGGGLFSRPQTVRVGANPTAVTAQDTNGDGRLDLVVANSGDNTSSVILNKFDPTKLYRYTITATDPDGDPLSFDLTDAPGGMILNPTTGEVVWAPTADQLGTNLVAFTVSDGRGGTATQSFNIAVGALNSNVKPAFTSTPIAVIPTTDAFTYTPRVVNADNPSLRYRLMSGPAGAGIDPTTGKVTWDPRAQAMRFGREVIPGSGQANAILVPDQPELQSASVTAEGWFNFDDSSRNQVLLAKRSNYFNSYSYSLEFAFGTLYARIRSTPGSSGRDATFGWTPVVGRWYHLAMTFDDATGALTLLIDGNTVATATVPADYHIWYSSGDASELAFGGWSAAQFYGSMSDVRIWGASRSQVQIRADMLRKVAPDAPNLIANYHFNDDDSITIRDSSANGVNGRRVATNTAVPNATTGLAVEQTPTFTIRVEDGRGGFDTQTFTLNVVPPMRRSIAGWVSQTGGGPLAGWVVYGDANNNGYRDGSELFATTAADGSYIIPNLLAGDYRLSVETQAGFVTPAPQTATVGAFADGTSSFAVASQSLGQIRGKVTATGPSVPGWVVFLDANGNSVRDDSEVFTTTDALGNFAFSGLAAGSYTVRFDAPSGWKATAPAAGRYAVTLATSGTSAGNDFAVAPIDAAGGSRPRFVTTPGTAVVARNTFRYASVAVDPTGRPITYALALAPAGTVIDSVSGLITWTPTLGQVGSQQVVVKAMNDRGGLDLQAFTVTVTAPNTAPLFSSIPPSAALVGVPMRHEVLAQDGEQSALTFALANAPAGATIDPTTGRITWTPTSGQVGTQAFTVLVRDGVGGETRQSYTVAVLNPLPNRAPSITTLPRLAARATLTYAGRITAADPDGDPLTFSLVSGPNGMTVSPEGFISWTPNAAQLGPNAVSVDVSDGRGGSDTRTFTIVIDNGLVNAAPVITSTPPQFTRAESVFAYRLTTTDADGDLVAFQLLAAPAGMSLDTARGSLRWQPAPDQLGPATVSVRAYDPFGGATTQTFTVTVRGVDGPPVITSVPPTEAAVGTAYLYSVRAVDLEGNPLVFTLLQSPAGMSINAVTGEIAWTPTAGQVGQQAVIIQVSDGAGAYATQGFAVKVLAGVPNRPPVFDTDPPLFTAVGTAYTFAASATDPEGQPVTYQLRTGPTGMAVDAASGLVTWTPTAGQEGTHVVTVAAFDPAGAAGVLSFELNVLAVNHPPVITGTAPTLATAGAVYRYDVSATDPDLDALTYSLVDGPSGMTVDPFGRVTWKTTPADVGPNTATVRVSDPRGGRAERTFTVGVRADTSPPKVVVIPGASRVAANSPEVFAEHGVTPFYPSATVRVAATDDVGVSALTATANGKAITLDPNGNAVFRFEEWGFGTIRVTATAADAAGNTASASKPFAFVPFGDDPAAGSVANPVAVITSPGGGATTGGFVSVRGTATSDLFTGYALSFRRADQRTYTPIVTGTGKVDAGELAKWDTSLLENDEYVLRLEVNDELAGVTVYEQAVGVSGNLKLGNFRLSFADMTIPVAGIPITLARTYDTLRADRTGDLGYGWRLEYRNTNLQVGLPKSGLESAGVYTAFRPGTKVYLTLPGGDRQGFTFTPDLRALPSFGGQPLVVATPRFTPDRGVTSTLSAGGGSVILNQFNELTTLGGLPWNPASPDFGGGYTLTLRDGTRYFIDGTSGLLKTVTDRNENTLTFGESGIASSNGGVSVSFARDANGRIVGVTDPAGNTVRYAYDSRGDLVRVTDRMGNATQFTYRTDRPHYLDSVIDPLGRTGARTEYDANGRLAGVTNGTNSTQSLGYDPDNQVVTTTDPLGRTTSTSYDLQGNVVASTDPLGRTRRFAYDDQNRMLSSTNGLGNTTRMAYDTVGNVLAMTDAIGNTTSMTYNPFGQVLTTTDPLGRTSAVAYDSRGNAIAVTDPTGATSTAGYDSNGNPIAVTDTLGRRTDYTYTPAGFLSSVATPDGRMTQLTSDRVGNLTTELQTVQTPNGPVTSTASYRYDANGRLVGGVGFNGANSTNNYDAAGQVTGSVDPLGGRTNLAYDSNGQMNGSSTPGGGTISLSFDAAGQSTQAVLPGGGVVRYEYDAAGQRTATVLADGTRLTSTFDAVGQSTSTRSGDFSGGNRVYDAAGRLVSVTDSDGGVWHYERDSAGQLTAMTDPLGYTYRYTYDAAGRVRSATLPTGQIVSADYDSAGNRTFATDLDGIAWAYTYGPTNLPLTATDANGHTYRFTHDGFNRLTGITDPKGRTVSFGYDSAGRVTSSSTATGNVNTAQHDALNRVTQVTDALGRTTAFTYTRDGQLLSRTDATGTTVYSYDIDGRLLSVTTPRGVTGMSFDEVGRRTGWTGTDGTTVGYTPDIAGRATQVTTQFGTTTRTFTPLGRFTNVTDGGGVTATTLDANGQPTRIVYANGLIETRAYDPIGRVSSLRTTTAAGVEVSRFTYSRNTSGQVIAILEGTGRRTDYTYDVGGRLITETVMVGLSTTVTRYTYDDANNLASVTDGSGTRTFAVDADDRLTGDGVWTYSWDAAGNMTSRTRPGQTDTFAYDPQNRLTRVARTGTVTTVVEYAYDYDELLAERREGANIVRFVWDRSGSLPQLLEERDGGNALLRRYESDGSQITRYRNGQGQQFFLIRDQLGSVRSVVDASGNVVATHQYDAFGRSLGSLPVGIGFTNGWTDTTGLVFLRSRWYLPDGARFTTRDSASVKPADPSSTANRYTYCGNDPVNHYDPTGQEDTTLASQSAAQGVFFTILAAFGLQLGHALTRPGASLFPSAAAAATHWWPNGTTWASSVSGGANAGPFNASFVGGAEYLNNTTSGESAIFGYYGTSLAVTDSTTGFGASFSYSVSGVFDTPTASSYSGYFLGLSGSKAMFQWKVKGNASTGLIDYLEPLKSDNVSFAWSPTPTFFSNPTSGPARFTRPTEIGQNDDYPTTEARYSHTLGVGGTPKGGSSFAFAVTYYVPLWIFTSGGDQGVLQQLYYGRG